MKIIRVFPRKTNATPDDENVRFMEPLRGDSADEIHISVTFTYDLKKAEYLYSQWKHVAATKIGGPATGEMSDAFTPGMYLKKGSVITSRGCNNKCWFCSVWKREGAIRELPITEGWNVRDDNLLACSDQHIISVFEMLKKQKHQIEFTGGIEAKLLKQWHVDLLSSLKMKTLYCAYDTKDDLDPLIEAGKMLSRSKISYANRKASCYVLIGYPGDTIDSAIKRIRQSVHAGFFPFAMLYRDKRGEYDLQWKKFQRQFANPILVAVNTRAWWEEKKRFNIF